MVVERHRGAGRSGTNADRAKRCTVTASPEPGPADHERDTRMTAVYVRVVFVEAVILVALWYFGRAFS